MSQVPGLQAEECLRNWSRRWRRCRGSLQSRQEHLSKQEQREDLSLVHRPFNHYWKVKHRRMVCINEICLLGNVSTCRILCRVSETASQRLSKRSCEVHVGGRWKVRWRYLVLLDTYGDKVPIGTRLKNFYECKEMEGWFGHTYDLQRDSVEFSAGSQTVFQMPKVW